VVASGYDGPFVLAQEKGWYAEEGLNVSFGEGNGSSTTISVVDQGRDDFGWADFGTMALLRAEGASVKAAAIVGQQSPLAIITTADSPIDEPKDVEGKVMGQNPVGATAQLFGAVAAVNDIDTSEVKTVAAKENTHAQLLAQGRTEAFTGWITFESPAVEEVGLEPKEIMFSDHGVNVMNVAIVVSDDLMENDPETVCGFVRASLRAWEHSLEDPTEAVDALIEAYPNVNRTIAEKQLAKQLELLHTDNSEGQPIGWAAEEDVAETVQILEEYSDLENPPAPSELFTNECIDE